jgi:hypothetical protein
MNLLNRQREFLFWKHQRREFEEAQLDSGELGLTAGGEGLSPVSKGAPSAFEGPFPW